MSTCSEGPACAPCVVWIPWGRVDKERRKVEVAKTDDTRFLSSLWREKLQSQQRRASLINRKLNWVVALFVLGALRFPVQIHIESHLLLYLVPPIALVFDLYIIGENYGIRRMGRFIQLRYAELPDGNWEGWLPPRRDKFSQLALPLSSLIILACSLVLLRVNHEDVVHLALWVAATLSTASAIYFKAYRALSILEASQLTPGTSTTGPPAKKT